MKIKTRPKPLPLKKLDAALPRLSPQFKSLPAMKEDARIQGQGYSGELKVDYHLKDLISMSTILDDVYLCINGKNVQIDSLVITQHAIFIIETKNYKHTITFNTILKHLTRDDGKVESGFEYPITQVENQKFHLMNWLIRHHLSHVPVHYFVAIADPATIVKVEGDQAEVVENVVYGSRIPQMIMTRDRQLASEGAKKLSAYQIGNTILQACGQFDNDDMVKKYNIKRADILPGVICPECEKRGMMRIHSGWKCIKCGLHSRHAHLNAIDDYLLLIKDSITNSECVRFLGLPNRGTATRILQNSDLIYERKHKCWRQEC